MCKVILIIWGSDPRIKNEILQVVIIMLNLLSVSVSRI